MRILISCERSGKVREAFRAMGHDAWSCDTEPADDASPHHYQCDVRQIMLGQQWDMMIAFPPCTYLSVSGMHRTTRGLRPASWTEDALGFVHQHMNSGIPMWAIENPVGVISTRIRRPDQIIQPYMFGEDASKKTCLWLHGLPRLIPTKMIPGRLVKLPSGKVVERWANQTDSGQNRLAPSEDRARKRSETYSGVALAMAQQWGTLKP